MLRPMPLLTRIILMALLPAGLASSVAAQVGHPPSTSPYRDIVQGQSLTFLVGSFAGDGGKLGIGPHNGTMYGVRYDIRLSNPIQVGFSVTRSGLERFIVDADDSVATRRTGPVSQSLVAAEMALQWNLTGKKTWHGLAPYFGGSIGVAFAGDTRADTSGYRFGTKMVVGPNLGFRFFVSRRLHLRGEARQSYWKLKYPSAYLDEPSEQPGTGASNAVIQDKRLSQWTGGRQLTVGLGYAVSF